MWASYYCTFYSLYLFRESEAHSTHESEAFSASFGFSQRCIQKQLDFRVDILLSAFFTDEHSEFCAQGRTSRVLRVVCLDRACIIRLASEPVALSTSGYSLLPSLFLRSLSADTAVVCIRSSLSPFRTSIYSNLYLKAGSCRALSVARFTFRMLAAFTAHLSSALPACLHPVAPSTSGNSLLPSVFSGLSV